MVCVELFRCAVLLAILSFFCPYEWLEELLYLAEYYTEFICAAVATVSFLVISFAFRKSPASRNIGLSLITLQL